MMADVSPTAGPASPTLRRLGGGSHGGLPHRKATAAVSPADSSVSNDSIAACAGLLPLRTALGSGVARRRRRLCATARGGGHRHVSGAANHPGGASAGGNGHRDVAHHHARHKSPRPDRAAAPRADGLTEWRGACRGTSESPAWPICCWLVGRGGKGGAWLTAAWVGAPRGKPDGRVCAGADQGPRRARRARATDRRRPARLCRRSAACVPRLSALVPPPQSWTSSKPRLPATRSRAPHPCTLTFRR